MALVPGLDAKFLASKPRTNDQRLMKYTNFVYNKKEGGKIMDVLKITSENFEQEVINADKMVVVDFYADWCGPCKMMAPIIEEIAKELEGKAKVGKINIDDNQSLAVKYQVMSIPTIAIFKQGKVIQSFVGVTDKQEILDAVISCK